MKSKTLLEALKLKTISQLQESLDMIIDNPNYVTHCTTDFKTLVTILKSGTINTSEKYNAACFSDGFVVRTDAPNQLIQMTTSAKNRWTVGICFYKNLLTDNGAVLTPFFDAKVKLMTPKKSDMYKIHYIFRLTDGTCIMRFASRQCPIEISQQLYDKIIRGIENQSEHFKTTHIAKDTAVCLKTLFYSAGSKYLQKRFPELNKEIDIEKQLNNAFIQVADGYIFATDNTNQGNAKGNKGPAITANSEFKLEHKEDGGYYSGTKTQEILLKKYYYTITSYNNEIKELEKRKQKLNDIDAANSKNTRIIYNDVENRYKICTDLIHLPKGTKSIKSEKLYLDNEIESKKKQLENYKTDWETSRIDHNRVGGVPILISEDDMMNLANSSELSEFEYRSTKPIEFNPSYIKYIYLCKLYEISSKTIKVKDDINWLVVKDKATWIDFEKLFNDDSAIEKIKNIKEKFDCKDLDDVEWFVNYIKTNENISIRYPDTTFYV